MKKVLSLLIIMTLVFTSLITGFAIEIETVVERTVSVTSINDGYEMTEKEAKISKEDAIEIGKKQMKKLFNTIIDEKIFDTRVEFRQDYEDRESYIWAIDWYKNDNEKSINVDVWINADTGVINKISKREYIHSEERPTIATMTKEEAKKLAEEFAKRINPEEFKETKLIDDRYPTGYGSTNYYFRYARMINDVKYDRNYINVQVDGVKGEVISYSYRWDTDLDVPSIKNIIDPSKAEEIMRENIDMTLNYIPYRDKYSSYGEKIDKVKLIYYPSYQNGYMVDAIKGTMMDYSGIASKEEKVRDISEKRKEEIYRKAKSVKELDKAIDQTRAIEVMNKYLKEIYGEDFEVENIRYTENEDYWETRDRKSWAASFYEEGNSRSDGGRIIIDALTEKLITVYKYSHFDEVEDFEPVITWEEGYDKAIEVIEKYFPEKIKEIDTEVRYSKYTHIVNGKEMPETQYYYSFGRIVDGISYREDEVMITVDTQTGKIRELRFGWSDDVNFPSTEGIISKEDAKEIYFEAYEPELIYTRINKSNDIENPEWEMKLAYRLVPVEVSGTNIDAFTGKFLDYRGNEINENQEEFKEKIKGHWAEKELMILAEQGIINLDEITLDKEITKLEAIKILVDAKGYRPYMVERVEELKFDNISKDNEEYKHLQLAIKYGILENEEGQFPVDEKITREELAAYIVKLLGYDELAKLNQIFKVSFKDANKVSSDKIGYVAICNGLGIIQGNNGEFRPDDNVTMAEMAAVIYKALGSIRE